MPDPPRTPAVHGCRREPASDRSRGARESHEASASAGSSWSAWCSPSGSLVVSSLVVVDETEYAVVTSFGRIVAVYGDEPAEAGLHRQGSLAARAQDRPPAPGVRPAAARGDHGRQAEPRGRALRGLAGGRPGRVPARSGDASSGRGPARTSGSRPRSATRSAAATWPRWPRPTPADWALDALTGEVLAAVAPAASDELGVEVVDLRLRRFNHPLEVRPAVFDLIRSERRQVAARLRAEGEAQYITITSQADRPRDTILAQADAEAERIRGQAEAEATRLLNEAHARDPKFYEFLRTLESYRSILDDRATVVLSSSSPLLKLLVKGPSTDRLPGPTAERTTDPSAGTAAVQNAARHP